jgi:hypothetical protein
MLLSSSDDRYLLCIVLFPVTFRPANVLYSIVLETGIFISQAIWLWRFRHVRHEAKKCGKTFDKFVAEHPSKQLTGSGPSTSMVDLEGGLSTMEAATENILTPEKCKVMPPKAG